jgi:molybdopterin molybdotransferase
MILVEEALHHILEQIPRLGKERVNILQSLGRVLGQDIHASQDIPPWDNSAMDGYAVKWRDIQEATPENPVILRVIADLPAGQMFKGKLRGGEAVRIMTGAPLPCGANTVVPVEETKKSPRAVHILSAPGKGKHIRRAGEDVMADERVLKEGTVIGPAHIGMLAALKHSFISVYQQPRVAILSTGDELLEIDDPWEEGKIINSNSYSLTAQVMQCGGLPLPLGIAKDQPRVLSSKIQEGLVADILVTSGGVSVGDYDFVKKILNDLGKMSFWKVAMRPGQPLAFGKISGKPLFGLPGNPVSSMVSFEQFVRPSILKMAGHQKLFRPTLTAVLAERVEKKAGLLHFIRCRLVKKNGTVWATTTGEQGSGILSSMVKAQGFIVLPRHVTVMEAGAEVTVMLLDETFFQSLDPAHLP